MKNYAIIVAGGTGKRSGMVQPKQFHPLHEKPMIFHSMEAFHAWNPEVALIIVLPSGYSHFWESLCQRFHLNLPHQTCEGGEQRYHSVKNGLGLVNTPGLVAVHDAARPLVGPSLIGKCYNAALEFGAAVPVISLRESPGRIDSHGQYHPIFRAEIRTAQTPQCFQSEIIQKAYQQAYREQFTDDASVVYAAGYPIHTVEGETDNIKITYPEDMNWAERRMNNGRQ